MLLTESDCGYFPLDFYVCIPSLYATRLVTMLIRHYVDQSRRPCRRGPEIYWRHGHTEMAKRGAQIRGQVP